MLCNKIFYNPCLLNMFENMFQVSVMVLLSLEALFTVTMPDISFESPANGPFSEYLEKSFIALLGGVLSGQSATVLLHITKKM